MINQFQVAKKEPGTKNQEPRTRNQDFRINFLIIKCLDHKVRIDNVIIDF